MLVKAGLGCAVASRRLFSQWAPCSGHGAHWQRRSESGLNLKSPGSSSGWKLELEARGRTVKSPSVATESPLAAGKAACTREAPPSLHGLLPPRASARCQCSGSGSGAQAPQGLLVLCAWARRPAARRRVFSLNLKLGAALAAGRWRLGRPPSGWYWQYEVSHGKVVDTSTVDRGACQQCTWLALPVL